MIEARAEAVMCRTVHTMSWLAGLVIHLAKYTRQLSNLCPIETAREQIELTNRA